MKLKQWITLTSKAFYTRLVMHRFLFFVRCEIETRQFLGSQDKYYMFRQSGWYNIITKKFKTDHKVKGSHDVWGFTSFKDFQDSVVRYF